MSYDFDIYDDDIIDDADDYGLDNIENIPVIFDDESVDDFIDNLSDWD